MDKRPPACNCHEEIQKIKCNEEWIPPPTGWLKINSDMVVKDETIFAAFVVRSDCSLVTHALSKEFFCFNISLAELHAIRLAVEFMHNLDADKAIFESDSLAAIQWSKRGTMDARGGLGWSWARKKKTVF
ncbi:UNVERIFIED_CONTAM: hypothetical protein Slati_0931600 [Sesamum latifolium]|uniref:RNase H type-1 domain-containing protein n=1 Tax=Sesamum latifolium TaxID=2727402 RepID=A0AAW2XS06_9LAMI